MGQTLLSKSAFNYIEEVHGVGNTTDPLKIFKICPNFCPPISTQ